MSEWLDDFLDIAEVALSDRPQLLEALLWCALSLVAGFDTSHICKNINVVGWVEAPYPTNTCGDVRRVREGCGQKGSGHK